jgi:hypothetical protein
MAKAKEEVQILTLIKLEELKALKEGQIILVANEGWWVLGTFNGLDDKGINVRGNDAMHWSDLTKLNAVYLFLGGTINERIEAAKDQLLQLVLKKKLIYW